MYFFIKNNYQPPQDPPAAARIFRVASSKQHCNILPNFHLKGAKIGEKRKTKKRSAFIINESTCDFLGEQEQ
jgi:hypothetical protein